MAPKKKDAGPSAQEVEDGWKIQEQAWLDAEKQLAYQVQLQKDDCAHFVAHTRKLEGEIQMLAVRSKHLVDKSTDLRLQYLKQCKAHTESESQERHGMTEQDQAIQEANDKVVQQRAELVQLSQKFEHAAAANSDQVRAVTFRQQGISALREKVVKMRSERAHLHVELKSFGKLCRSLQEDSVLRMFRRRPDHCIVVGSASCAAIQQLQQQLVQAFSFDVSFLSTTLSRGSQSLPKSQCENGQPPRPLHSLSFLSYIEPAVWPVNRPGEPFAFTFSDLMWSAARGNFGDERRLVIIQGTASLNVTSLAVLQQQGVGPNGDVDGVLLAPRDVVDLIDGVVLNSPEGSFLVPIVEIFEVLCKRSHLLNSVVVVELEVPQLLPQPLTTCVERVVIIASPSAVDSCDAVSVMCVTSTCPVPASSCVGVDGCIAATCATRLLALFQGANRGMAAKEFCNRLADKILSEGSHVSRAVVPKWLLHSIRHLAAEDEDDEDLEAAGETEAPTTDDGTVTTFIPPSNFELPLLSSSSLLRVRAFAAHGDSPKLLQDCTTALQTIPNLVTLDLRLVSGANATRADDCDVLYYLLTAVKIASATVVVEACEKSILHRHRLWYDEDSVHVSQIDDLQVVVRCERSVEGAYLLSVRPKKGGTTLQEACGIPERLRGSDLQSILSRPLVRGGPYSVSSIMESDVVHMFADSSNAAITRLVEIEALCKVATRFLSSTVQRIELPALTPRDEGALPPATPLVAPSVALLPSFPHLSEVDLCDAVTAYYFKRGLRADTTLDQQIHVLVVLPPQPNSSVEDGSYAPLQLEQQLEVLTAITELKEESTLLFQETMMTNPAALYDSLPTSGCDNGCGKKVVLPASTVQNMLCSFVGLDELQCSDAESTSVLNVADDESTSSLVATSQLSRKRDVWRRVMSCFSPQVVSFLTALTYPCVVVTSPMMASTELQALVVPRSLETMKSPNRPDCLFRKDVLKEAVASFYSLLLRTDTENYVVRGETPTTSISLDGQCGEPQPLRLVDVLRRSWIVV